MKLKLIVSIKRIYYSKTEFTLTKFNGPKVALFNIKNRQKCPSHLIYFFPNQNTKRIKNIYFLKNLSTRTNQ